MAGPYETWKARHAGRPVLLAVAGIGFFITFSVSYLHLFKPWMKRRKIAQAEEYANILESRQNQN